MGHRWQFTPLGEVVSEGLRVLASSGDVVIKVQAEPRVSEGRGVGEGVCTVVAFCVWQPLFCYQSRAL